MCVCVLGVCVVGVPGEVEEKDSEEEGDEQQERDQAQHNVCEQLGNIMIRGRNW